MIDENKRIECPHCRSEFVIGKFFAHREICSNLSITERNRQNNSRIRRRGKLASNLQMNQDDDIPAAQPCPVSQPEQQPLAQHGEETEWEDVMKEIDAIFCDSVEAPQAAQPDRSAAREKWRNMSAMPAPKRPAGQNPLECTFCHSVFPKADKCAIHMRTCAAMPYDMWIALVRLSGLCPDYAEHACPYCGTKFTTNKGCNAHANQCRRRRKKWTIHKHMSLAPHFIRSCTIMISPGMFWLSVADQMCLAFSNEQSSDHCSGKCCHPGRPIG